MAIKLMRIIITTLYFGYLVDLLYMYYTLVIYLPLPQETLMRPRKPNWSTEQKLMLVQLVKARREGLLTGRHSCRETATNRRWAWDEIAEEISTAYPDVPRTGKECERHWFIEQAKAKESIVNQKSPTGMKVSSVCICVSNGMATVIIIGD